MSLRGELPDVKIEDLYRVAILDQTLRDQILSDLANTESDDEPAIKPADQSTSLIDFVNDLVERAYGAGIDSAIFANPVRVALLEAAERWDEVRPDATEAERAVSRVVSGAFESEARWIKQGMKSSRGSQKDLDDTSIHLIIDELN